MPTGYVSDEEFNKFCELATEEGRMPAGRIKYVTGVVLWIDGNGRQLTSDEFKAKNGFDPAPVWDDIQKWRAANGTMPETVKIGAVRSRRKPVRLGCGPY